MQPTEEVVLLQAKLGSLDKSNIKAKNSWILELKISIK
jgi:hypothetical protein